MSHFGWVLISRGKEAELNKLICTVTFIDGHENHCKLDVLGVIHAARDNSTAHQDFKISPGESTVVGSKMDWCGNTVLIHYKSTIWVVWKY